MMPHCLLAICYFTRSPSSADLWSLFLDTSSIEWWLPSWPNNDYERRSQIARCLGLGRSKSRTRKCPTAMSMSCRCSPQNLSEKKMMGTVEISRKSKCVWQKAESRMHLLKESNRLSITAGQTFWLWVISDWCCRLNAKVHAGQVLVHVLLTRGSGMKNRQCCEFPASSNHIQKRLYGYTICTPMTIFAYAHGGDFLTHSFMKNTTSPFL